MADLKIPNWNKNSDKFLFKKKLSLRRKSKRKLLRESFFMFSLSILLFYFNYIIPNKLKTFQNLFKNFGELINNISDSFIYTFEICLALFIIISLIFSLILMVGAFSRIIKILKRKSRQIILK